MIIKYTTNKYHSFGGEVIELLRREVSVTVYNDAIILTFRRAQPSCDTLRL